MNRMQSIHDLIEEAKVRFLWWTICIFCITYFLSHTSKSMWMNVPIAVLIALLLRVLANKVEFHLKLPHSSKPSYLSSLEKKQLPVNDSRFSTPPPPKWKRKFDSPLVEAAVEDFVNKIIQDFVTDLWYSDITPDKEAPELMRVIILEALGEVAVRVKQVNLVDLLTRDLVDLIGDHIELFRRTQASIGVDVMVTLSSEERDERIKHHLMASNDLHPALISDDSEFKVLQRLVAGLLGVVLRPREAQCPLVRCIAREFVTCLVVQPIMNLVSPAYVNELLELVLLHIKDFLIGLDGDDQPSKVDLDHPISEGNPDRQKTPHNSETDMPLAEKGEQREPALATSEGMAPSSSSVDLIHRKVAGWARGLDAAAQRRTEVLAPENLENMWARGRHYKEKMNETTWQNTSHGLDNKMIVQILPGLNHTALVIDGNNQVTMMGSPLKEMNMSNEEEGGDFIIGDGNKGRLRRSSSTSDLKEVEFEEKRGDGDERVGLLISEDFYSPDLKGRRYHQHTINDARLLIRADGSHSPKLKCRVIGAYFEKLGSKSFAVYSIAVTDPQNNTWFVKRRYRNFERLHRHLKDIPNYNLHLPPKRIFSSSTEDSFVHQRCIQLDKYLQDLLSIANVAEQHEVWDFLSASSKSYSFGKSSSMMKTLAVNVDDAVDDIVRQFKGVSDGLVRKVVGSSSGHYEYLPVVPTRNLSWNERDLKMRSSTASSFETANQGFDIEVADDAVKENGWHSDNELNSKSFPPHVIQPIEEHATHLYSDKTKSNLSVVPNLDDPAGVPPEWAPPNVTVPMLNLVDKVFQLNRRGWIRRHVFWMSKQILQLVMEDAIDDWLLGQIGWLRREDVVAQGIQWVKDILWPDGKFFLMLEITGGGLDETDLRSFQATPRASRRKPTQSESFEMHLEAARRASFVKEMLFNGAPAPLVSLVGQKQYKRCAQDIYFFLQSSICLKQVAFAVLELLLASIFPELKDIVADVHKKKQTQPA